MSNRGALIVAAALTAFVLVVAGGIAGRLSKPEARAGGSAAPPKIAIASRTPAPRPVVRPAMQTWRDDDDEYERRSPDHRRHVEAEHEDDDD